jgi:hypothetical protein
LDCHDRSTKATTQLDIMTPCFLYHTVRLASTRPTNVVHMATKIHSVGHSDCDSPGLIFLLEHTAIVHSLIASFALRPWSRSVSPWVKAATRLAASHVAALHKRCRYEGVFSRVSIEQAKRSPCMGVSEQRRPPLISPASRDSAVMVLVQGGQGSII